MPSDERRATRETGGAIAIKTMRGSVAVVIETMGSGGGFIIEWLSGVVIIRRACGVCEML